MPNDPDALVALLRKQQAKHEQQLALSEQNNEKLRKRVQTKNLTIEKLEERLRVLLVQQYGKRSERINPDQLSFLNEAEIIAEDESDQTVSNEQGRQCSCGGLLERIREDVHEQLSIVPRQYFVERHILGR